jgi:hypothetical protein
MPQMIHYQDDLFALSALVKALDLVLATDADPDFFAQRVEGDVAFLDVSLRHFGGLLIQNSLLIERAEYLKLLERAVRSFAGILDRLAGRKYPHAEAFARGLRLEPMLASQKALLASLDELLKSAASGESETELVSQDEMSELLRE